MLDNLKKYNIILASNSPRRKELLARLGLKFKVRSLFGLDESYPDELRGEEISRFVSQKKAEAYRHTMDANDLIITADTMVYCDDTVLGKPVNVIKCAEMLRLLSGKTHEVITGVTIMTHRRTETFTATTKVTFTQLTDEDIDYYIKNYLPLDKAGGYGIQEWIGMIAVENINGSFFNVMGLPVQRLYSALKKF